MANSRVAARKRLGSLYNAADYPNSLSGLFGVEWDYPAIEPPNYLRELSPELFEQEQARVAARFDEAVRLAEEAFTGELAKLVSHLAERLAGTADGRPKIFRDSALTNLAEFFERFRQLNVRSNADLDDMVDRVQQLVRGVEPRQLREQSTLCGMLPRNWPACNRLSMICSSIDRVATFLDAQIRRSDLGTPLSRRRPHPHDLRRDHRPYGIGASVHSASHVEPDSQGDRWSIIACSRAKARALSPTQRRLKC